eukprot:CAMPEP_0171134802 /NCGR_PEP_ID=MMETSP0766_2-20121228/128657_1 /TAXON_ID=439317 /ORGANISM="Gambierdiscus australes, Strain CAWD 149" /LENGTH=80 /DNA_ID=CAMNT_0011598269 /DNA_START=18 /DNA_END=257 /DNA_ORIENTATION=+
MRLPVTKETLANGGMKVLVGLLLNVIVDVSGSQQKSSSLKKAAADRMDRVLDIVARWASKAAERAAQLASRLLALLGSVA